jgi:hypothetical protein
MPSVICGGFLHPSVNACAAYHGVPEHVVEESLYVTGMLEGMSIRFGPDYAPDALTVVYGQVLLGKGHCVHRLGAYHGERF